MTGSTVPDGFITETRGDLPGVSLNGGLDGSGEKLAEQIQAKFIESDARIAALTARVNALENGTGGIGWVPISHGVIAADTFDIDLTADGKYASPPLWSMVRIGMRYDLDATGAVNLRINGDNDNVYRSGSTMVDAANNFDDENWFHDTATFWRIAHGSTISTNNLELVLFSMGHNPGLINFQCSSARQSSSATTYRHTLASGALLTGKTASHLQFLTGLGASTFVNAWWWAEGLRMDAPL